MKIKVLVLSLICFLAFPLTVCADEYTKHNPFGELVEMEATAYNLTGVTFSGQKARHGIVAGREDDIGKVVNIYTIDDNGKPEFYGTYEVLDTGSDYRLQNGTCLDIWMEDIEDCREWGRQKIYAQFVDGKG